MSQPERHHLVPVDLHVHLIGSGDDLTGGQQAPECPVAEAKAGPAGLCYVAARWYVPWLGRWASCDPAGGVDGPNLYAYVRGNPMRLGDPTGTQAGQPNPPSPYLQALIARHPEAIHKPNPWTQILAYPNPIAIQNTAKVGSPVYKAIDDAEGTMMAANVSLWVSLAAFSGVLAAEMGLGGLITMGKEALNQASLRFAVQHPRISYYLMDYLAGEAGVANTMPITWELAAVKQAGWLTAGFAAVAAAIHGNRADSPRPTVLYALYETTSGMRLFLKVRREGHRNRQWPAYTV